MKRREDSDNVVPIKRPQKSARTVTFAPPPPRSLSTRSDTSESNTELLELPKQRKGKHVDRSGIDELSSTDNDSDSATGSNELNARDMRKVPLMPDQYESDEYEELDKELEPEDPDTLNPPSVKHHHQLRLERIPNQEFTQHLVDAEDAPPGVKIEPFNVEPDLEEGEFDEQGNFVFKRGREIDPMGFHDQWLDGWEDPEKIQKAREAKERQEQLRSQKEQQQRYKQGDLEKCRLELAGMMLEGVETVKQTLKRLGNEASKAKPKSTWAKRQQERKQRAKSGRAPQDSTNETVAQHPSQDDAREAQKRLDRMTELVFVLLESGMSEVYDMTRRQLLLSSP